MRFTISQNPEHFRLDYLNLVDDESIRKFEQQVKNYCKITDISYDTMMTSIMLLLGNTGGFGEYSELFGVSMTIEKPLTSNRTIKVILRQVSAWIMSNEDNQVVLSKLRRTYSDTIKESFEMLGLIPELAFILGKSTSYYKFYYFEGAEYCKDCPDMVRNDLFTYSNVKKNQSQNVSE